MKSILLFISILSTTFITAQAQFGIEIKTGRHLTFNSGAILGNHCYEITSEENAISSNYNLGVYYKLNKRNLIKFNIGKHQNGRILDLNVLRCGSIDNYEGSFENVDIPIPYLQLSSSFTHRFLYKNIIFPVELSFILNKRGSQNDIFYLDINSYNFDAKLGSGIHYRLLNHFILGINANYSMALNNYLDNDIVEGIYKPNLLGVEFSLMYEL